MKKDNVANRNYCKKNKNINTIIKCNGKGLISMLYISYYHSPIGKLLIATKDEKLIGLWFENQKYYLANIKEKVKIEKEVTIIKKTKDWLNRYFNGEKPKPEELDFNPIGSDFQKSVWNILIEISYGEVMTYNEIAQKIAKDKGISKMSAQAVGGAVGHNPISIIIPCHRVVGSNGHLTGYAGGIEKKKKLLQLEGIKIKDCNID